MIATLMRTRNMRRRNLIMFYCWFVSSMLFYGLAFSGSNLNVSLYGLSTLAAVADIISLALSSFFVQRFGRRPTLCISYIIGGIACISIVFIPLGHIKNELA
ncbi:Carcinine transporter [Armadillidium vulgare]|nr:Carcinine transporter [Armadillidium vulgare]